MNHVVSGAPKEPAETMLPIIHANVPNHLSPVPTIKIKLKPRRKVPPPPVASIEMIPIRTKSLKPIKKSLSYCQSCVGFLTDWFLLPPHKNEYWASKLKWHILFKNAPILANEFYRLIQSMTQIDTYVISNTITHRLTHEKNKFLKASDTTQTLEEIGWRIVIEQVMSQRGDCDINHIKALIQDSGMIRLSIDCDKWIGYVVSMLWCELPKIHMEHKKLADASGGGPAFGMRSYIPTSNCASVVSPHTSSSSSPPGSFAEDDLYR